MKYEKRNFLNLYVIARFLAACTGNSAVTVPSNPTAVPPQLGTEWEKIKHIIMQENFPQWMPTAMAFEFRHSQSGLQSWSTHRCSPRWSRSWASAGGPLSPQKELDHTLVLIRGSRASRKASPIKLNAKTNNSNARPGKTTIHQ